MITIRSEKPEDFQAIYEINKQAFNGESEAKLVNNLRNTNGFIPGLSLVALKNDELVGHILFSIIYIKTDTDNVPILALAPMAVLPEYQRSGIGAEMLKKGLKRCKSLRYKAIVVLGHPEYYSSFEFVPAKDKGLKLPFDAPDEAFMVYEITPNSLAGATGVIEYPPEFADM